MLKQRIITAAILIPVTLAIVFYIPTSFPYSFLYITGILALYAGWEWSKLAGVNSIPGRAIFLLLLLAALYNLLVIKAYFILVPAALWWMMALLLVVAYPRMTSLWNNLLTRCAIGFLVIVPCWLSLNLLRYQPYGQYVLLYLLLLVWGADITAYFAGRAFGSRLLHKKASPGKTVEGVVAALLFTFLLTIGNAWLTGLTMKVWMWSVLISMVTVIFSIVGDLFESIMKREAKVKDSGGLLPGHGGFLDRIDSLTAAAPIFALCALILGRYMQS